MNKQQLKNSILQWAIQGKLVPQIASEGTAEDLLKEIRKEKECLVKEGKLKKKDLEVKPIAEDEVPFDVPESWRWCRWGDLSFSIQYGYNAPAQTSGTIKMVRISDIHDNRVSWNTVPYCVITESEIDNYKLQVDDILFARTGGTVGKSFLVTEVKEESVYAGYLIRTRFSKKVYPKYAKYFMETSTYWEQLRDGTIATAQPNCNGQTLSRMMLPLPPLSEQKRIVAKIEELMPLVEEYGQAQERLVQLNKELPDKLKKSILQEAIMGKLVPQIASEGTAEDLLKEIRKEKERLVKEGKLKKKDLEVKPIAEDEVPFDVPESWRWVRLEEMSKFNGGYAFKSEKFTENTLDIRVIRISDFNENGLLNKSPVYHPYDESIENYMAENNDILICMTGGTVGKTCLVKMSDEKMYVNQRVADIHCSDKVDYQYVFSVIRSNYIKEIVDDAKNSTNDNISAGLIKGFLIPLPPLAEQKRIVAKIEELMKRIDNIY